MEFALFMALTFIMSLSGLPHDPILDAWKGRNAVRDLECERQTQQQAHEAHPIEIPAPSPRGAAFRDTDVLVCRRRLVRADLRKARDEMVLGTLSSDVQGFVHMATAEAPATTRWRVDAFYPQPQVAQKIADAARTSLAEQGHIVAQQAPWLAAGDVSVLHDFLLEDALPVACERLHKERGLQDDEAMLALAVLRAGEGQLHAGVCRQGAWRWLR